MGRKLFYEKGINAAGKVLAFRDFVPFTDRGEGKPRGLVIQAEYAEQLIKNAEKLEGKTYGSLLASDYMRFREDGDRITYEKIYSGRRTDLMTLFAAELAEGQGRFLKKIIDLVWLICDESTWVLPAHNLVKEGDTGALPYCIDAEYALSVDYIDLFSAATGAELAAVLYFLGDRLAGISKAIPDRLKAELDRRILKPVLDRRNHRKMFWLGKYGSVNNWCPWIISNLLTAAAFAEYDTQLREDIVQIGLEGLDAFLATYREEGSCDEGPNYWTVAGGALFNALEVLWDLTGGRINIYDDPKVRNMFEFIARTNIAGDYFFCFADSPVKLKLRCPWMLEMGKMSGSSQLTEFSKYLMRNGGLDFYEYPKIYMMLHQLGVDPEETRSGENYKAVRRDYLQDLKISVNRENEDPDKGFFLGFKGGHNGEGHNHNDVGEVVVYLDGEPVLIDPGSGTYTRRLFSSRRYDISSLQSGCHNVATVNGIMQPGGPLAHSSDERWNETTGELSMELSAAYPGAGLVSYRRSAKLENGAVTVTDEPEFCENGYIEYNYMCRDVPEQLAPGRIRVGRTVLEYSEGLNARIETVPMDEPESVTIPQNWGADKLCRIVLKSGTGAGKRKDVVRIYRS